MNEIDLIRSEIRKAIRLIHADAADGGDYEEGMRILCRLSGVRMPYLELKTVPVSIPDVARRPSTSFRVKRKAWAERERRRDICREYILRFRTLDEAKAALKRERGMTFNTSVWLGAYGDVLDSGKRPGGGPR